MCCVGRGQVCCELGRRCTSVVGLSGRLSLLPAVDAERHPGAYSLTWSAFPEMDPGEAGMAPGPRRVQRARAPPASSMDPTEAPRRVQKVRHAHERSSLPEISGAQGTPTQTPAGRVSRKPLPDVAGSPALPAGIVRLPAGHSDNAGRGSKKVQDEDARLLEEVLSEFSSLRLRLSKMEAMIVSGDESPEAGAEGAKPARKARDNPKG